MRIALHANYAIPSLNAPFQAALQIENWYLAQNCSRLRTIDSLPQQNETTPSPHLPSPCSHNPYSFATPPATADIPLHIPSGKCTKRATNRVRRNQVPSHRLCTSSGLRCQPHRELSSLGKRRTCGGRFTCHTETARIEREIRLLTPSVHPRVGAFTLPICPSPPPCSRRERERVCVCERERDLRIKASATVWFRLCGVSR
jgi:hypothetical protein